MYQDRLSQLDEFGLRLVKAILRDDYLWELPGDYNPVIDALERGDFVLRYGSMDGFNKGSVSRAAVVCQMAVFDANGGPDEDNEPRALRRHWYAYFKTRFAIPFSQQLATDGDDKKEAKGTNDKDWGTAWAGRLSEVYASLVDEGTLTYKDLWVKDASRMMEQYWTRLFRRCHIIVAVEKDSLFGDFEAAAKAIGARTLVSGKGKMSKAATELVLREHFGWSSDHDPFNEDEPLIILHVSDHDCDGQQVIGPTFAEQCRRYTSHILEARVGIDPSQISREDWSRHWYDVKLTNGGYIDWAERLGLFEVDCLECGHVFAVQGSEDLRYRGTLAMYGDEDRYPTGHECPHCGSRGQAIQIKVGKQIVNPAYGFEVEALKTREYYRLIVDALLSVLPLDTIIEKLRDECTASSYEAARRIQKEILERNRSYQELLERLEEYDRMVEAKEEFERKVKDELQELGQPHESDWRDLEDDPTAGDFESHVVDAGRYAEPWRPFSEDARTDELVEWLKENEAGVIASFEDAEIEW